MSARTKLNAIVIAGSMAFAALLGLANGSWLIFVIVAVGLAAIMVHAGEIRLRPRDGHLPVTRTGKGNRHR